MLDGISQNQNKSLGSEVFLKQEPLILEENDKTTPMNLFEARVDQKIQGASILQTQENIEPEFVRFMENVEVVA